MTDRCLSIDELAALAAISRGDPLRSHVDACPRCEAIILSYEDFESPAEPPEAADAERASAHLESVLRREILGPGAPHSERQTRSPQQVSLWRRLGIILQRPILGPAIAAGAVALIVVLAVQFRPGSEGENALRGESAVPAEPVPAAVRTEGAGGLILEWQPHAEADRSVVVLYRADLSEIDRLDAARARTLRLPSAEEVPSDEVRYWRVICYRERQELARSPLQELSGD